MTTIHHFRDHAMATHFEVRLAHMDATYAAQAAQACFERIHALEAQLSRFRPQSEICRVATLRAGESMRLQGDTFSCLERAKAMETSTSGAFSPTAAALQKEAANPQWHLTREDLSIHCASGSLDFDLGAIGKGFALDQVAELLREWECYAHLLVAGGSSILAGDPPPSLDGWSCGLGEDESSQRIALANASLSGSGTAVKGSHILDPRTGSRAARESRAWALCDSAAESDALSTAAMVLSLAALAEVLDRNPKWLVLLEEGEGVRSIGRRPLPPSNLAAVSRGTA